MVGDSKKTVLSGHNKETTPRTEALYKLEANDAQHRGRVLQNLPLDKEVLASDSC